MLELFLYFLVPYHFFSKYRQLLCRDFFKCFISQLFENNNKLEGSGNKLSEQWLRNFVLWKQIPKNRVLKLSPKQQPHWKHCLGKFKCKEYLKNNGDFHGK